MNSVLTALNNRLDLEKKFGLWLFALLAFSVVAYFELDALRMSLLATVVRMSVVCALATGIAHYLVFKPLRRVTTMAKAIGSGDFSKRLRSARHDEIGGLAREMDAMCDQLQAAQLASDVHLAALEQLRQSDRVATLGRLASSVAHELGNPLNVIELRAQLITSGDAATLQKAQESAAVIVEQTRRMTRIIEEILSFARNQPAKLTRLDLVDVVRKAIALCQHTARRNKASIVLDLPKTPIEIDGDADKLLQIIVNLVMNGVQAMPSGGTLKVSLRDEQMAPVDDPSGEQRPHVCIDVSDQGVGIPADVISKVFQPFFSTKGSAGGTGLGLSVAQGIAREHAGYITATSEVGRGSSFKVHLPQPDLRGSHGLAATR